MKLAIYEDESRTGNVDLDERTFEYSGSSESVRELLTRMEDGELTSLRPTSESSQSEMVPEADETDHRPGMREDAIGGKALGRHLRRALADESEIRVEAVDGTLDAETIDLRDDGDASTSKTLTAEQRRAARYGPPEDSQ